MRVRVVVSGVLAGAVCIAVLYFQYYRFEPSGIVPGWPYAIQAAMLPGWISRAVLSICALMLFAFGWVSARWSWAKNWRTSILAGAGMGMLAGCLIFGFIGVFWFTLQGQAEILQNFYLPVAEPQGIKIIVEAIFRTGTLLYSNFMQIIPVCSVLGALGGLLSALVDVKDFWGRHPRKPQGWLFRLPAYLLVICGYINLIVTIAVLQLLSEKAMNSAIKLQEQYNIKTDLGFDQYFLPYALLAGLLFTFLPAGITWGWIIRAWLNKGKPGVLSALWLVATAAGVIYALSGLGGGSIMDFSIFFYLVPLVVAVFIGLIAGWMADPQTGWEDYRVSDWLGFLITYGTLGGTQIIMGAPSFSIALALIAIVNIPHLTATGIVDKSPVEQVVQLFGTQVYSMGASIVFSMILGLIVAGLIALFRSLFRIRDMPPPQDA